MPKIHFFTQADNQPSKAQKEPPSPKAKYRLTNWPEYNKALVHRGHITLWLDETTLSQWYYQGPRSAGGLFLHSEQCIQAVLSLKAVFRLAFRQTQGLIQSILDIMKMELQVPSYTQPNRRPGNELHAVELTTNAISDADMVEPLVAAITYPIARLGGDGAYDQVKVYDELETRGIEPVIPPRSNAVIWTDEAGADLIHPRNKAFMQIECVGSAEWKRQVGYHRRSKAETGMFRWKATFGDRLSTRLLANQQAEARVKASCLNRLTKLGMPRAVKSVPT